MSGSALIYDYHFNRCAARRLRRSEFRRWSAYAVMAAALGIVIWGVSYV